MNRLMRIRQRGVLALAAVCVVASLYVVLIGALNPGQAGAWFELSRDTGHNILGIPWWVWAIGGAVLVAAAIIAAPELIAFAPEIAEAGAEAAAEGAELESGTAAEAIEEEIAAAQSRLESLASKVNPAYDFEEGIGTKNCSWAAREVDQGLADMLAGRTPEPYAPDWYEPDLELPPELRLSNDLSFEAEYGTTFQESSMDAIADQLGEAGNGARGIVKVTSGSSAHVFNAVNYGGEVFFVDGQTGAVWQGTELAGYAENSVVDFLPTAGF